MIFPSLIEKERTFEREIQTDKDINREKRKIKKERRKKK